ncbi:fasciclin domain-containing protein [Geofilum sp. OHC36d9]|uniref:fasciclin domain-containing protein n=1 Tax=Geofilum sp. OHC36d9 TaxID=3458413 RepID=UPI004034D3AE
MSKGSFFVAIAALLMLGSCKDTWDEYVEVSDQVNQLSLTDYIASQSDYSQFYDILKSTSVAQMLDSSTVYTVWIPTNEAMQLLDESVLNNEVKKRQFALNHIAFGLFSSRSGAADDSVYMMNGKKFYYQPSKALIDGVSIQTTKEVKLKNGFVQVVSSPIALRNTIWDWVMTDAPDNKFITYLRSLDFVYFDAEASGYLGTDDQGKPIYRDSVVYIQNQFLLEVADLQSEDSLFTFLVPSDDVFQSHFDQFERYFRLDDRESNVIPTSRDSAQIWINVAKDFVFSGSYDLSSVPDTLISYFNIKVPFVRSSVTQSFKASNGYTYLVSDCHIKSEHKILPVLVDAEQSVVIFTGTSSFYKPYFYRTGGGSDGLYFREKENALNGFDVILDNQSSSGILEGMVLMGPLVSSVKYRVKMRAFTDFNASPKWPDTTRVLRQYIAPVTVLRDKTTRDFTGLSPNNNKLRSTGGFGTADVVYDTSDETSYYIPVSTEPYSENPLDDEIDLGYYDYRYMEYAFFRIIPLEAKMAVVVDYLRLVPVLE